MNKGIKLLGKHFCAHKQTIIEIIQVGQDVTCQMNVISSHGKREKDVNVSREAPRVRKVCETFIHNVKSVMRQNGILDAFWGGNLRDKHIDGTLIGKEEGSGEADDHNDSDDTQDDSSTSTEDEVDIN